MTFSSKLEDILHSGSIKLLAGPILRRADPNRVCIWVATNKNVYLQGKIFLLADLESDIPDVEKQAIGFGTQHSLKIGENLYVSLVEIKPVKRKDKNKLFFNLHEKVNESNELIFEGTFPEDQLLGYDIELFGVDSSTGKSLKDLTIPGKMGITYWEEQGNGTRRYFLTPTFFLHSSDSPLNLLHGSCRKLHGLGDDSISAADNLIFHHVRDIMKRPSVLLLTGDQIYADDVAGPLIKLLSRLGKNLLGWDEPIAGITKDEKADLNGFGTVDEIPIYGRQHLVETAAGFTSGDASNHLLTVGEYIALYLMALNIENWPEDLNELCLENCPPDSFVKDKITSNPDVSVIATFLNYSPKYDARKLYEKQLHLLKSAYESLPAIRRVLANIPTYMILDDHDITDDWNLDEEWVNKVSKSDCGNQIIANGLVAYWIFQGWGNDPDSYNKDFKDKIIGYMNLNNNLSPERTKIQDFFINLNWNFSVPTNDPPIIFVDTRTRREFPKAIRPYANLLSNDGKKIVSRFTPRKSYTKFKPLLIVTPSPVFGYEYLEKKQARRGIKDHYRFDVESWHNNPLGLLEFLIFIRDDLEVTHCIFLSGDVHYAFTVQVSVLFPSSGDTNLHVVQLTSSSIKNSGRANKVMARTIASAIPLRSTRYGWSYLPMASDIEKKLTKKGKSIGTGICLSAAEKMDLKIREIPSWTENRIYKKIPGVFYGAIYGDTNMGLFTIASEIKHTLLTNKDGRISSFEVTIKDY